MFRPILLIALTLCATTAEAGSSLATKYRPANMFGGYKDRLVEPGIYRIDAHANGVAGPGFAQNMAAYRAAEILRQGGFEYMQVIDQKGQSLHIGTGGSSTSAGGSMTLWVRGSHNPAAPTDCRAKKPTLCFTLPTARTMDRIRPYLSFPSDGS